MKAIGYVYLTTNKINGKVYVGQHTRFESGYLGSGTYIKQAINKYGKENFEMKVLKKCYTVNQLNGWETYYTLKYNPKLDREVGYNLTVGPVQVSGNKNPACQPETIKKMTKINRRTTSNPEYRKRQSEIMKEYYKNRDNHFKGRKHTEESKRKMSEAAKGRVSPNKGKPMSEEQKLNHSKFMKGRYTGSDNPNWKGGISIKV